MTDDERQRFKKRYQDLSVEQLEAALNRVLPHAAEYRPVLREMIEENRRAEDQPERERFEKIYKQTERHHREGKRAARIAALVSIIGAAASWFGVLVQWHHSPPPAAPASPPAVTKPPPTPAAAQSAASA